MSKERACRRCGCTWDLPCLSRTGACCWVEYHLCSSCLTGAEHRRWLKGEERPSHGKDPINRFGRRVGTNRRAVEAKHGPTLVELEAA